MPFDNYYRRLKAADGTYNAIGDYSSTALDLSISPGEGRWLHIHSMSIKVEDTDFDSGFYGDGITLTNGINVLAVNGSGSEYSFTEEPIMTNADWAMYCEHVEEINFGKGLPYLTAHWHFKEAGHPIILQNEDKFIVRLNDLFTGLTQHKFIIHGHGGSMSHFEGPHHGA